MTLRLARNVGPKPKPDRPSTEQYDPRADPNVYIDLDPSLPEDNPPQAHLSLADAIAWLSGVSLLWFTIVRPVLELIAYFK